VLRALLLLLILANALWWGWSHGWLPAGLLPWPRDDVQREPERLARQVHPERVQVLPPLAAGQQQRLTSCWQAGPLDEAQAAAAELELANAGLPSSAWQRVPVDGGELLRVPAADPDQQAALQALSPPPADDGRSLLPTPADPFAPRFRPCD
jgi:hypothetical protein